MYTGMPCTLLPLRIAGKLIPTYAPFFQFNSSLCAAGELNFVTVGVVLQLLSLLAESTRLTLVQILLQRKGVKLNPVSTMYYVGPCCLAFLIIPFVSLDLRKMMRAESIPTNPWVFLTNAGAAFGECATLS